MKILMLLILGACVARGDCSSVCGSGPRYCASYEDCRVTYIPGQGYYEVCGYFTYPWHAQPNYRPNWAHESFYWEKSGVPYQRAK